MTKINCLPLCLFFTLLTVEITSFAGFNTKVLKQIQEDDVVFSYTSIDGSVQLKCVHVFDNPETHDWDVVCGKGTKLVRQFRVHLLIREFANLNTRHSAIEVLYWIIDRDQPITKTFASTSSWIHFKNISELEKISFRQGVENDYASLNLEFKP